MAAERYGNEKNVGKMAIQTRMKFLEYVIMPTLTYGIEK